MMRAPAKALKRALPAWLALALSLPATAVSLSDPTAPNAHTGSRAAASAPLPGLTWTRVTENRREAVINGVKVTEGQRLGTMRIHRIRHGEVVIEQADKLSTLQVQPARIKRTP